MIKKLSIFALLLVVLLICVHYYRNNFKIDSADNKNTDRVSQKTNDGAVNEYGNTCENLKYHGYVMQQGKAVYVSRNNAVYRYFENQKPELVLQDKCNYLNIIDDTIYYVQNYGSIFSYTVTSRKKTMLSKNRTTFMIATKDHIYYVNQDDNIRIYRLKTDGSEDIKIIDTACNSFGMKDRFIYLTMYEDKKPNVFSVSIDTLEQTIVARDASFFTILDGHVVIEDESDKYVLGKDGARTPLDSKGYSYFTHDRRWVLNGISVGHLYAVTNGVKKVLVERPCFNINTTDKKVFCKIYSEEDKKVYTYSMNHDGTDMQKVE